MPSAWDVQAAIKAHLDPVLAALDPAVPLYHDAPPDAVLPYAEFAREILTPSDGFTHFISQDLVSLSVYSEHVAKKQVLDIMEAMRAALTDADLVLGVSGETTIACRYERMDTGKDADGRTQVGNIIFSVLFEH
jgi:hypothetical protein